jgi:tRNA nucleotidyltransferase (CCA-adding enzyme)
VTNIAALLEAQLDNLSLRQLRGIAAVAETHGAQTYLVGGAVRDALLGLQVVDIDIAVVGMISGISEGIAKAINARIVARSQFNTFSLNASGRHIDLAMARHETYTHPGVLPTVLPGTIQQDIARRDFTINAMAVSLDEDSFGELLDPLGSQFDLKAGIVRVLHDDSFKDDATRILRAARYAVRLGFTLEARTEHLLRSDVSYLDTISPARLRDEFVRVLQEGKVVSTLEMLRDLGALQAIHPALPLTTQTLDALRRAEHLGYTDKIALYFAILSFNLNASEKVTFSERLRLTSRWAQIVRDTELVRSRVRDGPSIDVSDRKEIYRRLRALDEVAILGCALCEEGSTAARRLTLYLNELRHIKPMLNGDDLLALGVPQGPRIGEFLHDLMEARLDGQVRTRQDEIELVQTRL